MSLQLRFKGGGLRLPVFALQIVEQQQKDRAVHQTVTTIPNVVVSSQIVCGLESLIQVPIPCVMRHEVLIVARKPIHGPIRRDHMRVIVGAIYGFCRSLVPTGPGTPIDGWIVGKVRECSGIVVKQAFFNAVLAWTFAVLKIAPKNTVDELLELRNLFPV